MWIHCVADFLLKHCAKQGRRLSTCGPIHYIQSQGLLLKDIQSQGLQLKVRHADVGGSISMRKLQNPEEQATLSGQGLHHPARGLLRKLFEPPLRLLLDTLLGGTSMTNMKRDLSGQVRGTAGRPRGPSQIQGTSRVALLQGHLGISRYVHKTALAYAPKHPLATSCLFCRGMASAPLPPAGHLGFTPSFSTNYQSSKLVLWRAHDSVQLTE